MRLKEFTAPSSICTVFDKEEECEGTKYGTYTIFCGSDYQFRVPDQPVVDKRACLVEAVKEYMASRVGDMASDDDDDEISREELAKALGCTVEELDG